jgi:hypothetical protein
MDKIVRGLHGIDLSISPFGWFVLSHPLFIYGNLFNGIYPSSFTQLYIHFLWNVFMYPVLVVRLEPIKAYPAKVAQQTSAWSHHTHRHLWFPGHPVD